MKTLLQPILIVAAIFVSLALYSRFGLAIPFNVLSSQSQNMFTVSAEGKATGVPDSARVSVGITLDGENLKDVHARANQSLNKLNAELISLGIKKENIKTTNYYINPQSIYSSLNPDVPEARGYFVSIREEIIVPNLDLVNLVVDTATANGANIVGELTFEVNEKKKKELQNEARKMAIEEAKVKAEGMAQAAGITLGKVVSIYETENFYPRPYVGLEASQDLKTTEVQPGSSVITSYVTLTFETR